MSFYVSLVFKKNRIYWIRREKHAPKCCVQFVPSAPHAGIHTQTEKLAMLWDCEKESKHSRIANANNINKITVRPKIKLKALKNSFPN
jgi:hypothetical protein